MATSSKANGGKANGGRRDTQVTIPLADFYKFVKVNGAEGTVSILAGPHIGQLTQALQAKNAAKKNPPG